MPDNEISIRFIFQVKFTIFQKIHTLGVYHFKVKSDIMRTKPEVRLINGIYLITIVF
jgi:hypothetical protein